MNILDQQVKLQGILFELKQLEGNFKLTKAIENVTHILQMIEYNNKSISIKSTSKAIKEKEAIKDYKHPFKPKKKSLWGI